MRRLLALILLLSVLSVALQSSPPARAEDTPAVPPGDFMGMVVRDPHYEWKTNSRFPNGTNQAFYDAMGRTLAGAGVRWVRIEIFAEDIKLDADDQPLPPDVTPGTVNTAEYEYFINVVAPRHGFKVIALLSTPLVRNRPDDSNLPEADRLPRFPTEEYPSGEYVKPEEIQKPLTKNTSQYGFVNTYMHIWLDNAFQVAKAFPYDKATGRGIAAFEVLNEENRYLNGDGKGMDPLSVATLLTKFYRVYKNVECTAGRIAGDCGDVKILLGGLHPDRCGDCVAGEQTDRQYLQAIYTKRPSASSPAPFQDYRTRFGKFPLDGVAYHPYPLEMRSGLNPREPTGATDLFRIPQRMRDIRAVMLSNGDAANKIWVTEIGDRGDPNDVDNQARQANFLQSVYWLLWQERDYVQTVLWFKYEDFATTQNTENWGLVRLAERPSWQTCPQPYGPKFQSCDYEASGKVAVAKQAFQVYSEMARTGAGLDTYRFYMPILPR